MRQNNPKSNAAKHELRPASFEEAGLFYALPPERDEELGAIGHVRIDFGRRGDRFYHTWHPRGPEELNTQGFKDELTEVVDELRESVLKDLASMRDFCGSHGGVIQEGHPRNYGYVIETDRYRYCLRCNPMEGDYQAYLSCFDKLAQKQAIGLTEKGRQTLLDAAAQIQQMLEAIPEQVQEKESLDLTITDFLGKPVTVRPRLELYSVKDFMGSDLPGLALDLDVIEDGMVAGPYATLTKSFGEFISIKNSAYIDTNNCPFAVQLVEQGIAEPTGFWKTSGYCSYPLWKFKEGFLRQAGAENYQKYAQAYAQCMGLSEDEGTSMEDAVDGAEEQAERSSPLEIRSLADLKRAIKPGTEMVATYHAYHPETVGLVRVVTEVHTNAFYSKIKDQSDHELSTCNHGQGFRTDFEKASCYQFDGPTIRVLDSKKNDGSVLFEFEVYAPEMKMDAQEETVESPTMTMGGMS